MQGIPGYCLWLSFSFFPHPFPFPCATFNFCPPLALLIREKLFSFGLMGEATDPFCSCMHEVSLCSLLVAGLDDDDLEWAFLGLERFDEQCLDLGSLGTRFKFKDKGLSGAGLRGITSLSPGAPKVRKTSGYSQGCSTVFLSFNK